MHKHPIRVMYIQQYLGGGSVPGLYHLVRELNKELFSPITLFFEVSPAEEDFRRTGADVINLSLPRPLLSTEQQEWYTKSSLQRQGLYRNLRQHYRILRHTIPRSISLSQLMKQKSVDVVHHNNDIATNRVSILAAHIAGIPQVCHVRGLFDYSKDVFSHRIDSYLAKKINSYIFMSKATRDNYERFSLPESIQHIIDDPFDPIPPLNPTEEGELRQNLGILPDEIIICNIGRITHWKGQDYFLRACSQVRLAGYKFKALVVGAPGANCEDQAFLETLKRISSGTGLSENVVFTGHRNDAVKIMQISDIVVHSSSQPEPFGRVIVEAMATGRPLIATNAGGVPEIVQDHITGLLVQPKDADSMAEAMICLLQNTEKSKTLASQAQKHFQERFSSQAHTIQVQKIYARMLQT